MPKRGERKYRCDDCKKESFHHWIEMNRAARMRCPYCGCARLEIVNDEARKDMQSLQQVRVDGGTPSTTIPIPPNKHTIIT
jgi:DNA-directed RNA polymerase subunit RPC12/RpoP